VRPDSDASRSVSPLVMSDGTTGFLAHDPVVLVDPLDYAAISAVAELAMSNSVTQTRVRERLAEVAASRERLIDAADSQRRRLERSLQAGPVLRLERVTDLLRAIGSLDGRLGSDIGAIEADLSHARTAFEALAQGLRPGSLTAGGLASAIPELLRRTPLTVDVRVTVGRADPVVESTLYFVCSEAITNAAKYAGAATITIRLRDDHHLVVLTIEDDGIGGARLRPDGGLRGLMDRVEGLGGRMTVVSPSGKGTRIEVEIPRRPSRGSSVGGRGSGAATMRPAR
jgi:signal transduction histidine kinase